MNAMLMTHLSAFIFQNEKRNDDEEVAAAMASSTTTTAAILTLSLEKEQYHHFQLWMVTAVCEGRRGRVLMNDF